MKILVFGNILSEKDNLALKLIPRLARKFPEIEFKEFDPTENLEGEIENGNLFILDVALGINKIELLDFNDVDKLELIKSCSMHDFDLSYNLKIFKKIGKLRKVKIIAVPAEMNEKEAFTGIKKLIREI